ncbi:SipW-dependent-type signal peptide-containing protein [Patescibacteria group bacterium]|nr:SipW-dependent-type signal peptide-containing protein [Patescibacteria group bacterium]
MKKILVSLSIIGVVAAVVIGATSAYFSDTETSTGNTLTAGTLDLQVVFPYGGEPYAGFPGTQTYNGENIPPVEINDVKPGDEGVLRYHINNIGTIGGEISITLSNVTNSPGATPEPELTPDNGELGANLVINIWYGDEGEYPDYSNHVVTDTIINDLNNIKYLLGDLTAEGDPTTTDGKDIMIEWKLPLSVGNEVQGDIVTFDIDLNLEQKD